MESTNKEKEKVFKECEICESHENCNVKNHLDCEKYQIAFVKLATRFLSLPTESSKRNENK
jgi:hypothetical protein